MEVDQNKIKIHEYLYHFKYADLKYIKVNIKNNYIYTFYGFLDKDHLGRKVPFLTSEFSSEEYIIKEGSYDIDEFYENIDRFFLTEKDFIQHLYESRNIYAYSDDLYDFDIADNFKRHIIESVLDEYKNSMYSGEWIDPDISPIRLRDLGICEKIKNKVQWLIDAGTIKESKNYMEQEYTRKHIYTETILVDIMAYSRIRFTDVRYAWASIGNYNSKYSIREYAKPRINCLEHVLSQFDQNVFNKYYR
jgi:hypothetical protein